MKRTEYIWIKSELNSLREELGGLETERAKQIFQNLDEYLEHRFEQHRDAKP